MTGRPAAEREENQGRREERLKSEERYADSVGGMQAAATTLRRNAGEMTDSNDRDLMLRLAARYEQRADAALRRPERLPAFAPGSPRLWRKAPKPAANEN